MSSKLRKFTIEEDLYLKDNYLNKTLQEMSIELSRALGSIHGRVKRLGLTVPKHVINDRIRIANQNNVNSGRFPKGHVPVNKGKKMPVEVYKKISATMFKKGNLPYNTRANGDISIREDKSGNQYKYIRTAVAKWELLHRIVWQQAHGTIKPGMVIKFKDGNSLNCELENLYITDRKGHMNDNTIHRYPSEVLIAIRAVSRIEKLTNNKL